MTTLYIKLDDNNLVAALNDEVSIEWVPAEFRDQWFEAPAGTRIGARKVGDDYVNPPEPPPPPAGDIVVDVPTFFMLFTAAEEAAIRASANPIVQVLLRRLDHPATKNVNLSLQANQSAVGYLAAQQLIAPGRVAQILTGVVS